MQNRFPYLRPRIRSQVDREFRHELLPIAGPAVRPSQGFSLPELIIAMLLLGAVTAVMMPLLLAVTNQRKQVDQRQLALVQAQNALDLLLSSAAPDATEDKLLQLWTESEQPAAAESPVLRDLERRVIVADRAEDQSRQLTVELRWKNHAGQVTTPVRLSGWQFPRKETQP